MANWLNRIDDFIQKYFTAGPTLMRALRVALSDVPTQQRGLIIIQIDGLSSNRFEKALRKRKMPFLTRLLNRREWIKQEYLSEIPTSTPAFQAGMFYGENDNIPGFQFFEKEHSRYFKMGYSDCAYTIQESFSKPGLLTRGSVFSSVYNGDADASLFIFSSLLAPRRWRFALRAWDLLVLIVIHLVLAVKIVVMAVAELFMALLSLFSGAKRRWGWTRELEIVGLRVGLSVITREVITLGTVIDINRGVPVIYLNYLGYDEHAHIRGPNSRFATWSLRGIDRCIRRIFRAARNSERKYDIYVLSDHGQSACRPFDEVIGTSLRDYIQDLVPDMPVADSTDYEEKLQNLRETAQAAQRIAGASPWFLKRAANWVGRSIQRRAQNDHLPQEAVRSALIVISTGPIAYVYWTRSPKKVHLEEVEELLPGFIQQLTECDGIGMITLLRRDGRVAVYSRHGEAVLHEGTIETRRGRLPIDDLKDPSHALRGLWRVTRFPRAGDICIWGGASPRGDISFSAERGAHCGWTEEETRGFILKPAGVDHDFSQITRHTEFYNYFYPNYAAQNVASTGQSTVPTTAPFSAKSDDEIATNFA